MHALARYDHVTYQSLLDSNDMIGVAESRHDDLLSLGDIICKYDLEGLVGVTLAHRHHNLSQSERIVWRLKEDATWIATPEQQTGKALSPKNWVVRADSYGTKIRPTEFVPRTRMYNPEIEAAQIVMSHSDFLREFIDAVTSNAAEHAFGLGILHQRREFNVPGTTVFETSSIKNRITKAIVIPYSDSDTDLRGVTLWHFTKLEGLMGKHRCASGNSGHCCDNA